MDRALRARSGKTVQKSRPEMGSGKVLRKGGPRDPRAVRKDGPEKWTRNGIRKSAQKKWTVRSARGPERRSRKVVQKWGQEKCSGKVDRALRARSGKTVQKSGPEMGSGKVVRKSGPCAPRAVRSPPKADIFSTAKTKGAEPTRSGQPAGCCRCREGAGDPNETTAISGLTPSGGLSETG